MTWTNQLLREKLPKTCFHKFPIYFMFLKKKALSNKWVPTTNCACLIIMKPTLHI